MRYLCFLFLTLLIFPFSASAEEGSHSHSSRKEQSYSLFDPDVLTKGDLAPDFSLVDQNGKSVTMKGLKGKGVFLTFIYTTCDTACPIILHNKKAIKGKIVEKLGVDVVFGAMTIDPHNDTVQVLKEYAKDTQLDESDIFLLTGEPVTVKKILKLYGIKVAKIAETGKIVGHANMGFVIGPDGVVSDVLFFDI